MPSILPPWWGDLLAALWRERELTAYTLTTQAEPSYRRGGQVLTLTFPTCVDASGWWLRAHHHTLRDIAREHHFPIQNLDYDWRSTAVPASWPQEPTALLNVLAIWHASACWRHGPTSPQAQEVRRLYFDAAHQERNRRRQHTQPLINH